MPAKRDNPAIMVHLVRRGLFKRFHVMANDGDLCIGCDCPCEAVGEMKERDKLRRFYNLKNDRDGVSFHVVDTEDGEVLWPPEAVPHG